MTYCSKQLTQDIVAYDILYLMILLRPVVLLLVSVRTGCTYAPIWGLDGPGRPGRVSHTSEGWLLPVCWRPQFTCPAQSVSLPTCRLVLPGLPTWPPQQASLNFLTV